MTEGERPSSRLGRALRAAGAPGLLITRAESGYYGDFTSPLAFPITQLVRDAEAAGLSAIARRAKEGEFEMPDFDPSDLDEVYDVLDWLYGVNSDPDVDLDGDEDEFAVAWDENAGWGDEGEGDDDGAEE